MCDGRWCVREGSLLRNVRCVREGGVHGKVVCEGK